MPNTSNDGMLSRKNCPSHILIIKCPQILHRAAAACHEYRVDTEPLVLCAEHPHRARHLRRRVRRQLNYHIVEISPKLLQLQGTPASRAALMCSSWRPGTR